MTPCGSRAMIVTGLLVTSIGVAAAARIDAANVARPGLAWSYDLPVVGSVFSAPLAVDGVLYFSVGHSVIHALDARSGKLLWRYDPEVYKVAGVKLRTGWGIRGIAFWDGAVYAATHDGRLIALADELETEFALTGVVHADTAIVGALLDHPGIHIGSGDAGAHINQFSGAGDTCYLFEKYVREEGSMSLERAVQRLTSDLARAWRIVDRGELVVGNYADLVVFDPATISRGEEVWVDDVPGSDGRYVRHATGVHQVIVNGQVLVEDGADTAARPGRLI